MKMLIPFLMVSILLISGCASQTQSIPQTGNAVGDKAPDFALTATNGQNISLSDLRGKPVVLYFMATWCPFCKDEYDKAINPVYPGDSVELISVSLDLNENSAALEKYRTQYNRPGLFAPGNEAILKDYNVIYTTTKYVIDKNGIILYKSSGELNSDNWKIIFDALKN